MASGSNGGGLTKDQAARGRQTQASKRRGKKLKRRSLFDSSIAPF